jgi:hypothetical protein
MAHGRENMSSSRNESHHRRHEPHEDSSHRHRSESEEIANTERSMMKAAIRTFDKKVITELTDQPTSTQVESLFRNFAHMANSSGIPVRSLAQIKRGQPVYPASAVSRFHPSIMERFNSTIYYKLESLIPKSVATYHDIVAQNTSTEDGYTALYQILSTVVPKLQDFRPKWGPALTKDITMYRFVNLMQQHTDAEATFNRPYTELEIITNIIQKALENIRYEMPARTVKATIQNSMSQ